MKQFDCQSSRWGSDSWRTPHFEYVAGECVKGIAACLWNTASPLPRRIDVDSIEQAIERSATKGRQQGRRSGHPPLRWSACFKQLEAK